MRSGKSLAVGLGFAMLTLLGSLSVAHAQYQAPPPPSYYPPPPPPRGMYRDGLVVGFGLGGGKISADNCGIVCGGAFMLDLRLGGMVNPRLALMGDYWGAFRSFGDASGDGSTVHSILTFAAQYWVTDMVWIKGGIGGGRMQLVDETAGVLVGEETGFAVQGGAGIELVQSHNFALDLQLRLGRGFYSEGGDVNSFALMVGFNWY